MRNNNNKIVRCPGGGTNKKHLSLHILEMDCDQTAMGLSRLQYFS
jgi:hypothetical protein